MTTQSNPSSNSFTHRMVAITLGAITSIAIGACLDANGALPPFGELDCRRYCDRVEECDDDVDKDECFDDCVDAMSECQADEQEEALDQLSNCADEECNELSACTIDAGVTCYFGII